MLRVFKTQGTSLAPPAESPAESPTSSAEPSSATLSDAALRRPSPYSARPGASSRPLPRRIDEMTSDRNYSTASSSAPSASSPRSTALPSAAASTASSSAPSPGGSDGDDSEKTSLAKESMDLGGPLDERRHFPLLDWEELSPWMKYVTGSASVASSLPPSSGLLTARSCSKKGL